MSHGPQAAAQRSSAERPANSHRHQRHNHPAPGVPCTISPPAMVHVDVCENCRENAEGVCGRFYEELIARTATSRRRKPFEAANHPFVDRCAFLLDSSFLEKARLAASRALTELETLSPQLLVTFSMAERTKRIAVEGWYR